MKSLVLLIILLVPLLLLNGCVIGGFMVVKGRIVSDPYKHAAGYSDYRYYDNGSEMLITRIPSPWNNKNNIGRPVGCIENLISANFGIVPREITGMRVDGVFWRVRGTTEWKRINPRRVLDIQRWIFSWKSLGDRSITTIEIKVTYRRVDEYLTQNPGSPVEDIQVINIYNAFGQADPRLWSEWSDCQ